MIVGRHRSCDQVLSDDTVSGRHCQIFETPDGHVIEDLGSSNGTFVNGKRVETKDLNLVTELLERLRLFLLMANYYRKLNTSIRNFRVPESALAGNVIVSVLV